MLIFLLALCFTVQMYALDLNSNLNQNILTSDQIESFLSLQKQQNNLNKMNEKIFEKVKNIENFLLNQNFTQPTTFTQFRSKLFDYLSKDNFKNTNTLIRRTFELVFTIVIIPYFFQIHKKERLKFANNNFAKLSKLNVISSIDLKNFNKLIKDIYDGTQILTIISVGIAFFGTLLLEVVFMGQA